MQEFFHMGGYAGYVWPAYGIAALVLVILLFMTLRTLRAREADLANLEAAFEEDGQGGSEARTAPPANSSPGNDP